MSAPYPGQNGLSTGYRMTPEEAAELQKAYEKRRARWAREIGMPYPKRRSLIPNRVVDVPVLEDEDDEEG